MNKKISFNYFYGTEADQFSFYRIPKVLFTNDYFKELSSDAKILYGLMLDRMSLSIKNQWFDEQNRAYIYFSIEDIMELLNCGRNKAIKSLQELDDENGIGLVEKKRQGFGKTNIIYVKSFRADELVRKTEREEPEKFQNQTSERKNDDTEVYKTNFKKSQKQTSRSPENKIQEVCNSNSNYNNTTTLRTSRCILSSFFNLSMRTIRAKSPSCSLSSRQINLIYGQLATINIKAVVRRKLADSRGCTTAIFIDHLLIFSFEQVLLRPPYGKEPHEE